MLFSLLFMTIVFIFIILVIQENDFRLLAELLTNVTSYDRNNLAGYLSKTDYGAHIFWNYLDTNWATAKPNG